VAAYKGDLAWMRRIVEKERGAGGEGVPPCLLAYTTRLEETPIWKAAKHLANADMVAYLVG
jgi:hypothetical protein